MRSQSLRFAPDKRKAREASSARRDKADRTPEFNDFDDRFLREVVENKIVGLEGLQAARVGLIKMFGRIERLQQKIDEAFSGAPFLPNLPPTCPANRRRFNTYLSEQKKVMQLFCELLELWSFACGLKRDDDWTPALIADINRRALQEAWRQNPNHYAAVNARHAPGDVAQLRWKNRHSIGHAD